MRSLMSSRVAVSSLALLLSALLAAACGGQPPPVAPPPVAQTAAPLAASAAPSAASAAPVVHPPGSFFSMSDEAKLKQMKTVVQPSMGKLFAAFDAKKYGAFGCKTCHGPNHEDPQKFLPKLTLSGDGFKKLFGEKPALMKFMSEQVEPAMATAMGEPPFDPATHKGFGCGGCHTVN